MVLKIFYYLFICLFD